MEPQMANIVSADYCLSPLVQTGREMPKLDNRLLVVLRVAHPDHLHLPISVSQSQMDLLVARLVVQNFDLGNRDQLLHGDTAVRVGVEHIHSILDGLNCDIVFRFHESIVSGKLFHCSGAAVIGIERIPKESLKVLTGDLSGH